MAGRKNKHIGSNLDDFLKEEGVLEEFEAAAIKKAIAWQIAKQMKVLHISTVLIARRAARRSADYLIRMMATSPSRCYRRRLRLLGVNSMSNS